MKTNILTTCLVVLLAMLGSAAAFAGGPVLPVEEAAIGESRPSSEGKWVPIVVGGAIALCLLLCGSDDDAPVQVVPVDPCYGC